VIGRNTFEVGIAIQEFLRAGQIQHITITRVPVLIGEGIPLFGSVPGDIQLRHIKTRQYQSGLVTSEYEVMPVTESRPPCRKFDSQLHSDNS
jgi:dihydrofolate reductase